MIAVVDVRIKRIREECQIYCLKSYTCCRKYLVCLLPEVSLVLAPLGLGMSPMSVVIPTSQTFAVGGQVVSQVPRQPPDFQRHPL